MKSAAKDNMNNEIRFAKARALNLPISTRHCVEICRFLRYKDTSLAKKILQDVIALRRPVPYNRFIQDTGHKAGMSAGRFPQKAANEVLSLIKSVEANAQNKGLDVSTLKIIKIVANKASIPLTGGRLRGATKRTHLEVEVKERFGKKQSAKDVKSKDEAKNKTVLVEREATKAKETVEAEIKEVTKEPPKIRVAQETAQETNKETAQEIDKEAKLAAIKKDLTKEQIKEEIKKKEAKPDMNKLNEISPAELLRRAQEKAAELNKKEKNQKDANEVSKLYTELQKKGSLRSGVKSGMKGDKQ